MSALSRHLYAVAATSVRDDSRPKMPVDARAIRVAVWGTGGVGTIAIEAINRRSDLELVAVRVHDPAKTGRDAGELARSAPLGILASTDAADIDVVTVSLPGMNRMAADLAPQWPTAAGDGMVGTTMRIVNAIPRVCAARPGLVSSLDLALTLPINPPPAT